MLSLGLVFSRSRGMLRRPNQNDTGFLLIHHGLIDEAESVLDRAVHDGHCDQFTLSNYALCKAAKGNFDQAKSLLRAATFRKGSSHGKAVVLFNDAIIHLMLADKDATLSCLKQAIVLSPKEIRRYCQRSVHLEPVRTVPAFYELFKDA